MIQIFYTLFSRSYPVLFICNFYQSTPSYTHRNKNKPILKSSSQENKNIKMETTKITTTLASLTMIFFMSTSSIANTYSSYSGDGEKTNVNNQISAARNTIDAAISTSATPDEFIQLRFDVNNFVKADKSEISELPSANEFKYLRFDANNFSGSNSGEVSDMPVNEFDYLRFDVNKYESENIISTYELPAK